jgi:hypothetical protein
MAALTKRRSFPKKDDKWEYKDKKLLFGNISEFKIDWKGVKSDSAGSAKFKVTSAFDAGLLPEDTDTLPDTLELKIMIGDHMYPASVSDLVISWKQMVRYYAYYSNVCRGKRRKENQDEWIPCVLEPDESSKGSRKNWARLVRKIYSVDPLVCPKCTGQMRIIAFIENQETVKKILTHLGLYMVHSRPPPRAPPRDLWLDSPYSQVPDSEDYLHTDPDYSVDDYFS